MFYYWQQWLRILLFPNHLVISFSWIIKIDFPFGERLENLISESFCLFVFWFICDHWSIKNFIQSSFLESRLVSLFPCSLCPNAEFVELNLKVPCVSVSVPLCLQLKSPETSLSTRCFSSTVCTFQGDANHSCFLVFTVVYSSFLHYASLVWVVNSLWQMR